MEYNPYKALKGLFWCYWQETATKCDIKVWKQVLVVRPGHDFFVFWVSSVHCFSALFGLFVMNWEQACQVHKIESIFVGNKRRNSRKSNTNYLSMPLRSDLPNYLSTSEYIAFKGPNKMNLLRNPRLGRYSVSTYFVQNTFYIVTS